MNEKKKKVEELANEVYQSDFSQIIIDLVQNGVEDLLDDETHGRDTIMYVSYQCSILIDIFNPQIEKEVDYLIRLEKALTEWADDYEIVNRILGLPPEA